MSEVVARLIRNCTSPANQLNERRETMNIVVLHGTLSSEPVERTLPSGTNVMNWEVTTVTDGEKRSVPVQWNDPPNKALNIGEGDEVVVYGTIRRRFFQAGGATASRTEVVAHQVAKSTQRVGVSKLLSRARDELGATVG